MAALAAVFSLCSGSLHAQQEKQGAAALVAPGFVYQKATFGDDDPMSDARPGLAAGVQIRAPRSRSTALVFEGTLQFHAVKNPHFPEEFLPLYVQVGAQIGRRAYVRPSGGVAFQNGSIAPVVGFALGFDQAIGLRSLANSEIVIRASVSNGLYGWIVGVQVPVGLRISEK
jgi:hypothetical protein